MRIKLVNQLPTGAAGNLPFPVDKTYMGSTGATDTDNRTALHMHGGNTPWISDGTPRQWVKPKGEAGPNRGVSAVNVPDMWFDSTGKVVPVASMTAAAAANPAAAGYSNDPGPGALTYFFTNQQSQRLMFYHDHAEGVTRLNVYGGIAAGYVLTDPTEQAMTNGGTVTYNYLDPVTKAPLVTPISKTYAQVLPSDVIPLVIQEKTFVPDDTTPVLNFYGPFKSQLQSQDPTWGWGSGVAASGLNGTGDLWVPHVYMTNQNPGDTTGGNSLGRWDFGSWFWPPVSSLTHPAAANAYYDPACVSSATSICQSATIPGMDSGPGGKFVSATPEAFNDTPLVNGTAYPYVEVEPKKYRLRMLSVGNDRMLNLSLVVAASKNSVNTTADGNAASNPNAATNTILCDGTTNVNQADCTEVRMLPFNSVQDATTHFPSWWYTQQKGGVTFDGRPAGVFDPATRGPAMVQIGTEGGFLSTPVVIRNQPVNFEFNLKNIVVTNVKEHALLLGPAERADVVVDFSKFAGSTILLYNDAPAPMPAFDLRLDYYTGDYDNTDTGGSFSTVPGYGPNSRTLLQFRVASSCSSANCGTGINLTPATAAKTSQDFVDTTQIQADPQAAYGANAATGGSLVTAVQTAFKYSQDEIIVPQASYNPVYGTTVADAMGANISRISDTQLKFTPFSNGMTSTLEAAPVTMGMGPKGIHELFTTDYGRMNALLSLEIPNTNFTVQTTVPLYYIDPPTELVKIAPNDGTPITVPSADPINQMGDGTQLWRITHNGVDSHAIHFHLFNLQVVNRVGWDGAIRMPELNELGWKETIRMNPLEDVIVALRPKKMLKTSELVQIDPNASLPASSASATRGMDFKVPNSHRVLDPSGTGMFYNLDPLTGNASQNVTSNPSMNFGWEYVWHCHILGHEENDMMRSIAVAQAPEAPTSLTAVPVAGGVKLSWTDNSITSNWVTIQRATDAAITQNVTMLTVPVSSLTAAANLSHGECASQSGCPMSYTDTTATPLTTYYYQVVANNTVGAGDANLRLPPTLVATLTPNSLGYDNVTASSTPAAGSITFTAPVLSYTFGPGAVNLSWTASTPTPSSYTLSRALPTAKQNCATATYSPLNTGTALSFSDTGTANNKSYCYQVAATSAAGTLSSAPLTVATLGAPGAPTNLTITNITSTGLTVGWSLPNPNTAVGYEVQQCTNSTTAAGCAWPAGALVPGTQNNLAVTGLQAGTPYFFRVRAYDPATSAFVTSTVAVTGAVAVADTAAAVAASTAATQSVTAGNVLTNDKPSAPAANTFVTNLSAATHTNLSSGVTAATAATATVSCTAAGVCSLALTSPAANTTTTARQASKRGTYTFTYTEQYQTAYGNFTSAPVTVTVPVN